VNINGDHGHRSSPGYFLIPFQASQILKASSFPVTHVSIHHSFYPLFLIKASYFIKGKLKVVIIIIIIIIIIPEAQSFFIIFPPFHHETPPPGCHQGSRARSRCPCAFASVMAAFTKASGRLKP